MIIDTYMQQINDSFSSVKKWCKAIEVLTVAVAVLVGLVGIAILGVMGAACVEGKMPALSIIAYTFLHYGLIVAAIAIAAAVFHDASVGETPFGPRQTRRLRIIGALLTALVAVELFFDASFSGSLDLLGAQLPVSAEATRSLSMPALILAALAFCLSVIFQYGSLLQGGHDETV